MFKEILKIIPRISDSDLRKMQQQLQTRFAKIAKGFGKGLVSAIKGGGIAGLALGLIDKLLNPLKETQEAIDRALKRGDDVVTNAKQFGTTAAKLFKLQAIGKATGLDPEQLDVLLTKFQGAVAAAKADPNGEGNTAVKQFRNDTDIADSFYQFIQQLQKMDKNEQVRIQTQVFGEKQILKMADFLNSDLGGLGGQFKLPGNADKKLDSLSALNDLKDLRESQMDFRDTFTKAGKINAAMIESQAKRAQLDLDRENERIDSYKNIAKIDETSKQVLQWVERMYLAVGAVATNLDKIMNAFQNMSKKFSLKSFFRGFGDGGGE